MVPRRRNPSAARRRRPAGAISRRFERCDSEAGRERPGLSKASPFPCAASPFPLQLAARIRVTCPVAFGRGASGALRSYPEIRPTCRHRRNRPRPPQFEAGRRRHPRHGRDQSALGRGRRRSLGNTFRNSTHHAHRRDRRQCHRARAADVCRRVLPGRRVMRGCSVTISCSLPFAVFVLLNARTAPRAFLPACVSSLMLLKSRPPSDAGITKSRSPQRNVIGLLPGCSRAPCCANE